MSDKSLVASLRALHRDNPAATLLLGEYAQRERNKLITKVDWVVTHFQRHGIQRNDIVDMFRTLEGLECGKYIPGRKGYPSRFEWSKSTLTVCKLATGAVDVAAPEELNNLGGDETEPNGELELHPFKLRSDLILKLQLPSDFTTREAERLGQFLLSLPREESR